MASASVRESVRTRGMGWSSRHSSRITHLLECVFSLEHCVCTYVESNPFRVIPILGISSSCRGNLLFQVQGAHGETTHHRGRFRRKPSCGFGFMMYYMY